MDDDLVAAPLQRQVAAGRNAERRADEPDGVDAVGDRVDTDEEHAAVRRLLGACVGRERGTLGDGDGRRILGAHEEDPGVRHHEQPPLPDSFHDDGAVTHRRVDPPEMGKRDGARPRTGGEALDGHAKRFPGPQRYRHVTAFRSRTVLDACGGHSGCVGDDRIRDARHEVEAHVAGRRECTDRGGPCIADAACARLGLHRRALRERAALPGDDAHCDRVLGVRHHDAVRPHRADQAIFHVRSTERVLAALDQRQPQRAFVGEGREVDRVHE